MRELSTAEEQLIMFMEIVDKQNKNIKEMKQNAEQDLQIMDGLAEELNELQAEVNKLDKEVAELKTELATYPPAEYEILGGEETC